MGNEKSVSAGENTRDFDYSFSRKRRTQSCHRDTLLPSITVDARLQERQELDTPLTDGDFLSVQVLFTTCVFVCAHFFIFLFFLCLLRMRFLAHLSLIVVSNPH